MDHRHRWVIWSDSVDSQFIGLKVKHGACALGVYNMRQSIEIMMEYCLLSHTFSVIILFLLFLQPLELLSYTGMYGRYLYGTMILMHRAWLILIHLCDVQCSPPCSVWEWSFLLPPLNTGARTLFQDRDGKWISLKSTSGIKCVCDAWWAFFTSGKFWDTFHKTQCLQVLI